MRIVIALGGNALLERGTRPDADVQVTNVRQAIASLAPLARDHELVLSHGNGPQVGLLALESALDPTLTRPYPFDALGAQTQGLIGYWLLQELENACPDRPVAALVTQTLVSAADRAFTDPTKFVGAVYPERAAHTLAEARGWSVARDGTGWRRVVPSPAPERVVEAPVIRLLVEAGVIVVCAGGGGVPVIRDERGRLRGIDAVVDKDLTAALLAEDLDADILLLLTDVAAVEANFGTPHARPIRRATPQELRQHAFPAGSMGPKVAAACRFAERTGRAAAIGALADAEAILAGRAGTMLAASRDAS
ncbi:MAG: carbamate kinase [Acidimicrobiia bacterium]